MPIIKERFVPSKKNYAIKRDSFRISRDVYMVDAVWAFKKKGEMYVSSGLLSLYSTDDLTVEQFQERFDSRYGGSAKCTWDGEYMTAQSPVPLKEMVEDSKILDPILYNLPNLPDGYDGWYRLI